MTRNANQWFSVGWAERTRGCVAQASGALTAAAAHFEEALRIFTSLDARYGVGRTRLGLGALAHLRGNAAEAAAHLIDAHRAFKALHVPRYVARTEALGARLGIPLACA